MDEELEIYKATLSDIVTGRIKAMEHELDYKSSVSPTLGTMIVGEIVALSKLHHDLFGPIVKAREEE